MGARCALPFDLPAVARKKLAVDFEGRNQSSDGGLRLLCEANPIAFIVEQAGGRASTGRQPVLGVQPTSLHQRIGLVFGSKIEVERIERYHTEPARGGLASPLFARHSLFRE